MLEGFFLLLKNLLIFSSYVDNKNSFPKPLSKEKEAEYLLQAQNGDNEAKEMLIRHNLRLVAHIAKKYTNYPDNDELISVGSIGLIKAINSYKLGKGTQLATYASKCIENEILMTLRAGKKHRSNISLQEPVGVDREGNEITLIDLVSTEADTVIQGVEQNILMERLLDLTKTILDKREYHIIVQRYGLGGTPALTQREVAEKFQISRSYVSRIEKRALDKIRAHIKKEELYFD
ncbi:MAG TPA: RNA polymerase sporulation sigma factor SigK [Clostridia bacterium]|nr:RNA polymerase sporulation sigma factor SigK [Clostridia bacterium]